jgi:hypothetical protein
MPKAIHLFMNMDKMIGAQFAGIGANEISCRSGTEQERNDANRLSRCEKMNKTEPAERRMLIFTNVKG